MRATANRQRGFSLIEIMIAAAIVAIIAAVAFPSYQDNVRKGARQVGKTTLVEVRGRQENHFVNMKRYATSLADLGYPVDAAGLTYIDKEGNESDTSSGAVYSLALVDATATAFTIQAVPVNAQTGDDACGTLSLTHQGAKAVTGTSTECW